MRAGACAALARCQPHAAHVRFAKVSYNTAQYLGAGRGTSCFQCMACAVSMMFRILNIIMHDRGHAV